MSSRRSRLARRKNRNVSAQIETLETRRLLTTLSGDGASFIYADSHDNFFRITLRGNVTAEFIGAHVTNQNLVALGDLVPAGTVSDTNPGRDLYAVYVTRADAMSSIQIVQVDKDTLSDTPNGAGQSLTIGGSPVAMGEGIGAGYLGAMTKDTPADIPNEAGRPLLVGRVPTGGIGVLPPQPDNAMRPGVTIANGQNLGGFFFDGIVSGRVTATGSIGTFYAGALLTGDTRGQFVSDPRMPRNFQVNGDLRNLLVKGSIGRNPGGGSNPTLYTGFDLQVRGVVGQIRAGSDITGTMDVRNALGGPFLAGVQREIESTFGSADQFFRNDSFDNPQYLSGYSDPLFAGSKAARVAGSLSFGVDPIDFYALPLLAGQTVTVQLVSTEGRGGIPTLGIWDPDQRLIATNENVLDLPDAASGILTFTADRPGLYRFSVGDLSQLIPGSTTSSMSDYSLRISGVGDIGVGAIVTDGDYSVLAPDRSGVIVYRGDFGALQAGGRILTSPFARSGSEGTINALFANIRVVQASEFGTLPVEGFFPTMGIDLEAPFGHVGLLRTTNPNGQMLLANDGFEDVSRSVIGGHYQVIDAAGNLEGVIVSNKGIGTIRAGSMATLRPSIIHVNFDNRNSDGVIDLIDVAGNFGSPLGGPQITTNENGNVRYLRVGGEIFRDSLFGTGLGTAANTQVFQAGETVTITDDSGAMIFIRPREVPTFEPPEDADPEDPDFIGRPAVFSVTTYPIRGSGGSVIVNLDTDRGVIISALTPGRRGAAEISRVRVTQNGAPVVFEVIPQPGDEPDLIGDRILVPDDTSILDVSVIVTGSVPVDILEIQSDVDGGPIVSPPAGGSFLGGNLGGVSPGFLNSVHNTTGGEMPIVKAASIGSLLGTTLGVAIPRATPAAVNPREVLADGFPFQSQRVGIIAEDIVSVAATQQLGNIIVQQIPGVSPSGGGEGQAPADSGTIGSLIANSDGIDNPGVFEGIVGPILAHDLRSVDIGEGLAASGGGQAQRAGLYANDRSSPVNAENPDYFPLGGRIESVTNRGAADIRGTIAATNRIQSIRLNNGAIIGSVIGVFTSIDQARRLQDIFTIPVDEDPITAPVYDVGEIVVSGNGGIIGTLVIAADIDVVQVNDGFGIMSSQIRVLGDGRVNRVVAGGYGIRDVFIGNGAAVTEINATGDGRPVNSALITPSVRMSEFYQVDPFFEQAPSRLTDIHHVLGTTATNRLIDNVTNSGIIDGVLANGSLVLNRVFAQRLRNSEFNFADRIELLHTRGPMRNLQVTSGRLDQLISGSDVAQMNFNIAGPIGDFFVTGSVDEQSHIRAIGPAGRIGRFQTNGFLGGDITTTGTINQLTVGRDILATSRVEADDILVTHIGGQVFGQIVIV